MPEHANPGPRLTPAGMTVGYCPGCGLEAVWIGTTATCPRCGAAVVRFDPVAVEAVAAGTWKPAGK